MYKDKFWVYKYRVDSFKNIILPKRLRDRFANGLDCNLILAGVAGNGKTTLARILAKPFSSIFVDGSTESGIDVIREKIITFCSTSSMKGNGKKVVIIDEVDGLSAKAQKSLKATTEKFESTTYFIFTSNHPENIIHELHSRFEFVNFNFVGDEIKEQKIGYVSRIKSILKKENVKIEDNAFKYLISKIYPDFRKTLGLLYSAKQLSVDGLITMENINSVNVGFDTQKLYDFMCTEGLQPPKIYEFVKKNYYGIETQTMKILGEPFLNYLNQKPNYSEKVLAVAMMHHKYSYESSVSGGSKFIALLATITTINEVLTK